MLGFPGLNLMCAELLIPLTTAGPLILLPYGTLFPMVRRTTPLPGSDEGVPPMATDYDEPRLKDDEQDRSLENMAAQRGSAQTAIMELDETDTAEGIELPGADLSGEELTIHVLPAQHDEFTCSSCFLVRHRTQKAREKNGLSFCRDCEG
jgi:hypothetical protein